MRQLWPALWSPAHLCRFAHTVPHSFKESCLPFRPRENPASPEEPPQVTPGHCAPISSSRIIFVSNQVGPWSILPLIVFSNFPLIFLLLTVSYLRSSSQLRQQDPQGHGDILNSLWSLVQNLPHGTHIFGDTKNAQLAFSYDEGTDESTGMRHWHSSTQTSIYPLLIVTQH